VVGARVAGDQRIEVAARRARARGFRSSSPPFNDEQAQSVGSIEPTIERKLVIKMRGSRGQYPLTPES
jgi:hypothetical protein